MIKIILFISIILFSGSIHIFKVEAGNKAKFITSSECLKAKRLNGYDTVYAENGKIIKQKKNYIYSHGAIIRGDKLKKELALVFTGDSFADGGSHIVENLNQHKIKASFFFTGNFYRNPEFSSLISTLIANDHYLGAHSDKHLLYCSWENRDSLLVDKEEFLTDLQNNYLEMQKFGISKKDAQFFMPPYEWYNNTISEWTTEHGLTLINYSPGTRSNADYTTPDMGTRYISSARIYNSIIEFESEKKSGLNGFILLVHIGTDPHRKDKFYLMLDQLITELQIKGYNFVRIDKLLE